MADAINIPTNGHQVPGGPPVDTGTPPPAAQVPAQPSFPAVPPIPASAVPPAVPVNVPAVQPGPQNVTLPNDGGNDPVIKSLTSVFLTVGAGIDLNRAIGNAIQLGNPALIDTAYITEKGGANAEQLKTIAQALVDRVQYQSQAAVSAAHSAAGGEAQWAAAATAFNQSAPAHLKTVVSQMLESGDPGIVNSAAQMVVQFSQQGGLVPVKANLLGAGAGANAAQALGKAEFQSALFKLNTNSPTYMQDRDALFQRRQLGKQLGK